MDKGEIFTLMGPSGSGKTSLLRCISGLERPDSGDVRIEGRSMNGLDASKRGIGMVFQDLALFPHMTVRQNIGFGLRGRVSAEEMERRVSSLSKTLGIEQLLDRYPSAISGGQRQRVALARTVAPSPKLMLFDEPLSSLDEQLRAGVRSFMKSFVKDMGLTAIYVTHDHREGLFMADRAGIIYGGQIIAQGKPEELFLNPPSELVAQFFGYNVLHMDGHTVAFLPGEFELSKDGSINATVISSGFEGEQQRVYARDELGNELHLFFTHGSHPGRGDRIRVQPKRLVLLEG